MGPDAKKAGRKWMGIGADIDHIDGNLVTAPWPVHPELANVFKVFGIEIDQ